MISRSSRIKADRGSEWMEFYDRGELVGNGTRIFGSSLVGSALCLAGREGVRHRRGRDGTMIIDDMWVLYPPGIEIHAEKSFVNYKGTAWNVESTRDGTRVSGKNLAKVMRIIG